MAETTNYKYERVTFNAKEVLKASDLNKLSNNINIVKNECEDSTLALNDKILAVKTQVNGLNPSGVYDNGLGTLVPNSYVSSNGTFVAYNGWSRTNYIDVHTLKAVSILGNLNGWASHYNAFYDADNHCLGFFYISDKNNETVVTLPDNCYYIVLSNATNALNNYVLRANYNDIPLPVHYKREINSVVSEVKNHISENTCSFAFMTDIHNGWWNMNNPDLNASVGIEPTVNGYALSSIHSLEKKIPLKGAFFGGDYLVMSETQKGSISSFEKQIGLLRERMLDIKTNKFAVTGNHDTGLSTTGYNPTLDTLTGKDFIYKNLNKYFNFNSNFHIKPELNVGYMDDEENKIRFIFLNASDGIDESSTSVYNISAEQESWFGHEALDFSNKKGNWGIIIISHTYFMTSDITNNIPLYNFAPNMHKILLAFKNGTTYGNYSYVSQGAKDVICAIVGHWHSTRSAIVDGIRLIETPNSNSWEVWHMNDEKTSRKILGTVEETAFDIFTIDKDNRKIYATRFGYCRDDNGNKVNRTREFDY